MAKLMVEIDMPNRSYEELREKLIKRGSADWFEGDPRKGMVMVDETYLQRAVLDDSFFVFHLIGVRP